MLNDDRQSEWLRFLLNLFGVAIVGYSIAASDNDNGTPWVLTLAFLSVLAWAVRSVVRILADRMGTLTLSRTTFVCEVVMVCAGAVTAGETNGVTIAPVAVALVTMLANLERPTWVALGTTGLAIVLVCVGAVLSNTQPLALIAMIAGVLVALLVGVSRRQFRFSEQQMREIRERELEVREERGRTQLLADRQEVARDIHDVLAHSLGGLVIQLDAVEALLEANRVQDATARITDARALAVSGLVEARRAVAALRETQAGQEQASVDGSDVGGLHVGDGSGVGDTSGAGRGADAADLAAQLAEVIQAHRTLGGVVGFSEFGSPRSPDARTAMALRRALQEALSNARKHAPGAPVEARLDWTEEAVRLTVSNPEGDDRAHSALAESGGGSGLIGMRERFAGLAHGGSVSARSAGGRFVVVAEAALA